jgi:hypothetical protein
MYNRALSQAEIQTLYTMGQSGSDLVAYYPFSGNADDVSGNGLNGTVYGGVTLTADRFGNAGSAYQFDGSDDYISLPIFDIPRDITLAFWIKTNASCSGYWPQTMFIIDRDLPNVYRDWSISLGQGGRLLFNTGIPFDADYTQATNQDINDGAWHYLVVVRDSPNGVKKIYVDGVISASAVFESSDFENNGVPVKIGACNSNPSTHQYFQGALDDLRFYDRALSAGEIEALFEQNN